MRRAADVGHAPAAAPFNARRGQLRGDERGRANPARMGVPEGFGQVLGGRSGRRDGQARLRQLRGAGGSRAGVGRIVWAKESGPAFGQAAVLRGVALQHAADGPARAFAIRQQAGGAGQGGAHARAREAREETVIRRHMRCGHARWQAACAIGRLRARAQNGHLPAPRGQAARQAGGGQPCAHDEAARGRSSMRHGSGHAVRHARARPPLRGVVAKAISGLLHAAGAQGLLQPWLSGVFQPEARLRLAQRRQLGQQGGPAVAQQRQAMCRAVQLGQRIRRRAQRQQQAVVAAQIQRMQARQQAMPLRRQAAQQRGDGRAACFPHLRQRRSGGQHGGQRQARRTFRQAARGGQQGQQAGQGARAAGGIACGQGRQQMPVRRLPKEAGRVGRQGGQGNFGSGFGHEAAEKAEKAEMDAVTSKKRAARAGCAKACGRFW